jgi:hypothetical protein
MICQKPVRWLPVGGLCLAFIVLWVVFILFLPLCLGLDSLLEQLSDACEFVCKVCKHAVLEACFGWVAV